MREFTNVKMLPTTYNHNLTTPNMQSQSRSYVQIPRGGNLQQNSPLITYANSNKYIFIYNRILIYLQTLAATENTEQKQSSKIIIIIIITVMT